MSKKWFLLVAILFCSTIGHTWCGKPSSSSSGNSAANLQKRAAEAKARKSAMLATIESRSIKLENTPKKINDKKLYRLILGSDDYKNKLEDKKNAVFLIIDDPSKCPVINEKIINEKNIWFVIIDKKVELTGKVDGTRQIVVVNSKVIIE